MGRDPREGCAEMGEKVQPGGRSADLLAWRLVRGPPGLEAGPWGGGPGLEAGPLPTTTATTTTTTTTTATAVTTTITTIYSKSISQLCYKIQIINLALNVT